MTAVGGANLNTYHNSCHVEFGPHLPSISSKKFQFSRAANLKCDVRNGHMRDCTKSLCRYWLASWVFWCTTVQPKKKDFFSSFLKPNQRTSTFTKDIV